MPLKIMPPDTKKRKAKRGQFRTAKKPYHDKTTLAKSERHPHSRLKTQKEYKAITDSPAYKKADYHTQNKMLKKHPTTMKKGGRANFRGGGRTNLLEELGRVEGEHSNRNRRAEVSRIHGELNRGYKDGKRVGLKHGTRGPHGFGPKPFLNKPGQAQGTHGGKIAKATDKAIKGNKLTKKA